MRTTFESLTADHSTPGLGQPTWLILEKLFTAQARLLRKEGAFRALFIVRVAIVRRLRMVAGLGSFTIVAARRGVCSTWQWGV